MRAAKRLLAEMVRQGWGRLLFHVALGVFAASSLSQAATIRVHYDTGWGHWISIRGSEAPLSWSAGETTEWTSGNVWVWESPDGMAPFEFKPLYDDGIWSVGANYRVETDGSVVDLYPFFGPAHGRMERIRDVYSPQLGNTRDLLIYLPPSYDENELKHYPVLYMHDGQNLFSASTAFGGVEWQVDETLDRLIGQGRVREVLVVGLENTSRRIDEYTPEPDPVYGGGDGDLYLDFITETVLPLVRSRYRTLDGRGNTAMLGSSLGGLISFYAGWTRSDQFGFVAGMSSSFWWNDEALTAEVEGFSSPGPPVRIYIDAGGVNDTHESTVRMRNALEDLGYEHGEDLFHWFEPSAGHNEASWAARLHRPLEALLPFDPTGADEATGTARIR